MPPGTKDKPRTKLLAICFLSPILAAVLLAATAAQAAPAGSTRVIVAFKPGTQAAVKAAVAAARGNVRNEILGMDAMAIQVPTQALAGLSRNPNVEYGEEDVKR